MVCARALSECPEHPNSTVGTISTSVSRPSIAASGLDGRGEQFATLLGKTLGVGLERSRERLAEHIEKHGLDERAGRWLQYGVEHSDGSDCPFCDQALATSDIYETLRALFGTDYKTLGTDVEAARDALRPLVEAGASNFVRLVGQNRALAEYWNSVIQLPGIPAFDDEELGAIASALNAMLQALEKKLTDLSHVALAWRGVQAFHRHGVHSVCSAPVICTSDKPGTAPAGTRKRMRIMRPAQASVSMVRFRVRSCPSCSSASLCQLP